MARTPSGRRMRISVPVNHAVCRHLDRCGDAVEPNAELLRLAEVGANLEELHGPIRSVSDLVQLLSNSRNAAAATPTHSPTSASLTDVPPGRTTTNAAGFVERHPPAGASRTEALPPAQPSSPAPLENQGGFAVDEQEAALAWLPDD